MKLIESWSKWIEVGQCGFTNEKNKAYGGLKCKWVFLFFFGGGALFLKEMTGDLNFEVMNIWMATHITVYVDFHVHSADLF